MATPERTRHYPNMKIRILWAFLECLCFSGLTGGWDLLYRTFSDQNLLFFDQNRSNVSRNAPINYSAPSDVDDDDSVAASTSPWTNDWNRNCSESDFCEDGLKSEEFDIISTRMVLGITALFYMLLIAPLGAIYDRYGTLKTRFIAIFLYTTSTLMITFMTPASSWLLVVSWITFSCSGFLILLTNLQLANLSQTKRCTIIAVYYAASKCCPLFVILVQMTAEYSTAQTAFMFLTIGLIPLLVGTIAFLPKRRLLWPVTNANQCGSANSLVEYFGKRNGKCANAGHDEGILSVLSSWFFWSQLLWFAGLVISLKLTGELRLLFQPNSDDSWLEVTKRHTLWSSALIALGNLFIGWAMDRYAKHTEESSRRLKFMKTLSICSTITGLLAIFTVILSFVIYNTTICDVWIIPSKILEAICFGLQTIVLSTLLPYKHLGITLGLSVAVSELMAVVSYAIVYALSLGVLSRITVMAMTILIILITFINVTNKWKLRNSPDITVFLVTDDVTDSAERGGLTLECPPSPNSLDNVETENMD